MHRPRGAIKQRPLFLLDDKLICRLLADLAIYDYLPKLVPIKWDILRLASRIDKLKKTHRVFSYDQIRKDYLAILKKFHALFTPQDIEALKTFLLKRRRINAKTILLGSSPH